MQLYSSSNMVFLLLQKIRIRGIDFPSCLKQPQKGKKEKETVIFKILEPDSEGWRWNGQRCPPASRELSGCGAGGRAQQVQEDHVAGVLKISAVRTEQHSREPWRCAGTQHACAKKLCEAWERSNALKD